MTNIVTFSPKKQQKPAAPVAAGLTEADMRWLCAATRELRRLAESCGPDTPRGQLLARACVSLGEATLEIANLEGV
jgi:hypothetical protein